MPEDETTAPTFSVRPAGAADVARITAIDKSHMGIARRGYFDKRLAGAQRFEDETVALALTAGERVEGFALIRLEAGEFGRPGSVAVLDAFGVDSRAQGHGAGHRLMEEAIAALNARGVSALVTQVDWAQRGLLAFLGSVGFALDGRVVLSRHPGDRMPEPDPEPDTDAATAPRESDYSAPTSDDFTALSRDRIPVRSLTEADLAAIVAIDRRHSGQERRAYYARKLDQVINHSGVRLSLMAEIDGIAAGFVMARLDYGEFGQTADEAVMEAIGVDPGFGGQGVAQALMSQLMINLRVLRAGALRTETDWNDTALIGFLDAMGFAPAQRISLCRRL